MKNLRLVLLGNCNLSFALFYCSHSTRAIKMKSTNSSEASKYGVQGIGVVIEEQIKLFQDFDEKEFENAILKRLNRKPYN